MKNLIKAVSSSITPKLLITLLSILFIPGIVFAASKSYSYFKNNDSPEKVKTSPESSPAMVENPSPSPENTPEPSLSTSPSPSPKPVVKPVASPSPSFEPSPSPIRATTTLTFNIGGNQSFTCYEDKVAEANRIYQEYEEAQKIVDQCLAQVKQEYEDCKQSCNPKIEDDGTVMYEPPCLQKCQNEYIPSPNREPKQPRCVSQEKDPEGMAFTFIKIKEVCQSN